MSLLLLRKAVPAQRPVDTELDEIPLRENFEDPQGRFLNYDAYDTNQLAALKNQQHIDIRSFEENDVVTTISMLYLDLLALTTLNNMTMDDLTSTTVVRAGERWTNGTVTKDPARKNWNKLFMPCSAGTNTTISLFVQ